jgi:uncharacterized protein (TIGR03083 family)
MKEFLDDIASESESFAATIRPDTLDRRVPDCPDWALRELVWHLGRVQQFWAAIVRSGVDEPPDFSEERKRGPSDAQELADWMRASTEDLLDALRAASPDATAWTWWKEPRTAGAIGRHQVQEAAVHRWDAQAAVGTPDPLPAAIADDGVEEFLEISRQMRAPVPITFHATDTGRTFTLSDAEPVVTASAPSADLVLLLYRRLTSDDVKVDGDRAVLDEFLAPIE